jgi:hypothetical protein
MNTATTANIQNNNPTPRPVRILRIVPHIPSVIPETQGIFLRLV